MSVPKGQIHTMQSIITNKNTIKMSSIQKNIESKPKVNFNISTNNFNSMNLLHKKGVSALAYKSGKQDRVSETHYTGRWMGFMYRDPNKPRGGCGVCYQH
tara:strand:+ start:1291 stop:1590 length:300 start_codon:yes stop_codon:yes gene_type:complete